MSWNATARAPDNGGIVLRTSDAQDLERVRLPHVVAVVCAPAMYPAWLEEVAAAVASGAFQVQRTILDGAGLDQIGDWLETQLPLGVLAPKVRSALLGDVLSLVERQSTLAQASRFVFRVLTSQPSRHCGFHVDTVLPGALPWGLLRVYNGAGTDYVRPDNVISMRVFYSFLSRRERLVRTLSLTQAAGDVETNQRVLGEIVQLDEERAFLKDPDELFTVPAGSTVAFKHLDVRLHWSNHAPALAWLHCSPMVGEPRLVISVTARNSAARRFAV